MSLQLQDIIEALVDVDAMFSAHTTPSNNGFFRKCPTYSDKNVFLGTEGVVEGEEAIPAFLYVHETGVPRLRFKSPEGMGYDSFDAIVPEAQFKDVMAPIEGKILRDYGVDLAELRRQAFSLLADKPQLIAHVNDQIAHGRKMRACAVLEEEAETRDGFYERQDTFGQF